MEILNFIFIVVVITLLGIKTGELEDRITELEEKINPKNK